MQHFETVARLTFKTSFFLLFTAASTSDSSLLILDRRTFCTNRRDGIICVWANFYFCFYFVSHGVGDFVQQHELRMASLLFNSESCSVYIYPFSKEKLFIVSHAFIFASSFPYMRLPIPQVEILCRWQRLFPIRRKFLIQSDIFINYDNPIFNPS